MAAPMNLTNVQAVIGAGQSLSAEVDLGPGTLVGIVIPSGWSSASLTFQATADGVSWSELVNSAGAALSMGVFSGGQYAAIDPTLWRGITAIKLRSGTQASPVVQASQQTLTLVTKVLS